jgi:transposase
MDMNFEVFNTHSMPIIYELCRVAKIREIVNEQVTWRDDNTKVSPGVLIESLVISIISGRRALWKLDEYWKKQDIHYLFEGSGITPEQLNDDAYGRALDKLSEVKMEELVSKISLGMLKMHGETIRRLHLDTTSISLEGAYKEDVNEGEFNITYGHSKDHRPDLKQFKIGAAVQESGLPVMGELLSGNTSDREWNPETVRRMREHFTQEEYKDIVYIGDSATVASYESLKDLSGIKFISRFPENFSIVSELKEKALEEKNWTEVERGEKDKTAKYRICGYSRKIDGVEYRFVVVNSRELREKKEKTIGRKIEREKSALEKKIKELQKKEFACEEDASRALLEFMKEGILERFIVESKIEEKVTIKYAKKGRPSKDEKGTEEKSFCIEIAIKETNEIAVSKLCDMEGCFVLITSIKDKDEYSDYKILEEYKGQNSVEAAFKFLKDPVYLGSVFLKKKSRVEALGYVFILVLLIAAYFEYRVRKSLKENNEFLHQPGGHKTQRPTVKTILELLENVIIIVNNGKRYFQKNMDEKVIQVIKWAGFDNDIYLKYSVLGERELK